MVRRLLAAFWLILPLCAQQDMGVITGLVTDASAPTSSSTSAWSPSRPA